MRNIWHMIHKDQPPQPVSQTVIIRCTVLICVILALTAGYFATRFQLEAKKLSLLQQSCSYQLSNPK